MIIDNLPSKTLLLWQIRLAVIDVFVLACCLYFRMSSSWIIQIYGLFTVIILLLIFLYLPKYIASYSIKITNDSVIINSGVIIKATHIMPYSRLIYTQTFTSPLAKKFKITAISLKAARSRIFIPEINNWDAEEFLSALSDGENE